MRAGRMKAGPSHIYVRMLQGKVSSERYTAVVRRAFGIYGLLPRVLPKEEA